uniref:Uncharacterized protein n=1 Tax=Periophthalmus magnuspinnatus TaxID=409849 RepID=A0A3B4BAH0_9GOBI
MLHGPRELTQNPLRKIWMPRCSNGLSQRPITQRRGKRMHTFLHIEVSLNLHHLRLGSHLHKPDSYLVWRRVCCLRYNIPQYCIKLFYPHGECSKVLF